MKTQSYSYKVIDDVNDEVWSGTINFGSTANLMEDIRIDLRTEYPTLSNLTISIKFVVEPNIKTKTHSSVKSQFSLHYIKTERLDKKYGQLFNILFDLRQKGDYEIRLNILWTDEQLNFINNLLTPPNISNIYS